MAIYNYLDLSTGHITEREARELDSTGDGLLCGSRVIPHDYGAWVHVPEPDAEDDAERREAYPNLQNCIEHARKHGAMWINFDQDGDKEDELPSFEW